MRRCAPQQNSGPQADKTIWEVFEAERPKLVPYAGRFDGFHAVPASVSKTCLVRFDNNKSILLSKLAVAINYDPGKPRAISSPSHSVFDNAA
jgi:hypothetical protein